MKTLKAIVLGAGGFIGGHLCQRLLKKGYKVRGVDRKFNPYWRMDGIEFIIGDLRNIDVVDTVIDYEADEVYQLAAEMGGAGFIFTGKHDADIFSNSALVNLNVASVAVRKKVKKLFYSSSACVYSDEYQTLERVNKLSESMAWPANPDSLYGIEKLMSEQLYLAYAKNYGLNVRIARFHNIYGNCFDDKTEVLTDNGWKYFDNVKSSDKIASLSDNNKLEYLHPIAYQKYWYEGEMASVESKNLSQLVTLNHNLYVSRPTTKDNKKSKTKYSLIKAEKAINYSALYFTSYFDWDGDISFPKDYILKEVRMKDGRKKHSSKKVDMTDWFEFIGWYVADGSKWVTPSNYTVCITKYQNYKPEVKDAIRNLLKRMDIHFSEDKKNANIIISNKQVYQCLEDVKVGAKNKSIPNWMLNAPKKYLKILHDTMMRADGTVSANIYKTVSETLKDQFMEISLKLGYKAHSVLTLRNNPKHNDLWAIYWSKKRVFNLNKKSFSRINYKGFVYDVTLPKYHILLTRRNGTVCWSGNCSDFFTGREKAPAAICRKVILAGKVNPLDYNDDVLGLRSEAGEKSINIWGSGNQVRSFLYISDCLDAVELLMNSDYKEPINIGSEEAVTINQLAKIAIEISSNKIKVNHIDGPIGVNGRCSDNTLINDVLGWKPKVSLRDGMKNLYDWMYVYLCTMKLSYEGADGNIRRFYIDESTPGVQKRIEIMS